MDDFDIKPILEGMLFVSESPVRLETLTEILRESTRGEILEGIQRIRSDYEDPSRGIELFQIADGYQFRTKPQWAEWIARLKKKKPAKLSQSALETLAIVAYRQPIIRPEIDNIRGVDSGWTLRSLLEKGLIKMMGRKDLPGRPIIYGTTKVFLELFSLNALGDLPSLSEVQPPIDAVSPQAGKPGRSADAVSFETGDLSGPAEAVSPEGLEVEPSINPESLRHPAPSQSDAGPDLPELSHTGSGHALNQSDAGPDGEKDPIRALLPALHQNGSGHEEEDDGRGK